ncbi:MAG: hypothetical protein HY860_03605 [Chlamydiales bacterium]|nr:hypothetical protein [Chlamydiales bacterium]
MKRVLLALLAGVFLFGCSRYSVMTQDRFSDISTGTPIATIEQEFGPPVEIRSIGKKQQVYEYVERVTKGPQVIQQRKYFLVVSDGKVVGKYVRFDNPPPYQAIYSDDLFPDNNN